MLSGRDEPDGTTQSGRMHLTQRVGKQRVPVAHPNKNGKRIASRGKADAQTFRLLPGNGRDRRHTAKELVMVGYLLDAFGTDTSAAQDVREERANIVEPLWPTERDDENGIERRVLQPYSA